MTQIIRDDLSARQLQLAVKVSALPQLSDIMKRHQSMRAVAVVFAVVLPTIVTWVYFYMLADNPLQRVAYSVGKSAQFLFPVLWISFGLRETLNRSGLSAVAVSSSADAHDISTWSQKFSLAFGVCMGLAVSGAMYAIYRWIPADMLAGLSEELTERIRTLGLSSVLLFCFLAIFYALGHSFLEEYYFRWFVFGQCRRLCGFVPAMLISGFAFMAHHVIVLAVYFGRTPLTAFLSLSIWIGGMLWAWQYERSRSLVGPWVSHMLVDAGIFAIGFEILNRSAAFSSSVP